MQEIYDELIKNISKEQILCDEPMSKHTTFRIGGPADIFVKIKNLENLKYVLKIAKNRNLPLTIIGNGSNVLVKDNGIRGIVIKLEMNDIQVLDNQIIVDAGATLTKICKVAKENELSGLEFAYGIPGTIGGAIVMNAGAYGGEMKSIVSKTTYMNDNLEVKTISKEEHNFSYRTSIFSENKSLIIISTVLEMTKGSKEDISNQMKQNINSRIEKQPVDLPNAGSTFKRGKDFITAKLIEEAGLKGFSIGGAMVSTKHAGFIINTGNAIAEDVLKLVEQIKKTIKEKFNKEIELEIKVLGE